MLSLSHGDHLTCARIGYQHHGIYVGNDTVIHYQGPFSGHEACQIVCASLNQFCQGDAVRVLAHPHRHYNREEAVDRAHQRLGEHSYNLLFNNCEHFVQWCIEGKHHSPQVVSAAQSVVAAHVVKSSVAQLTTSAGAGLTGAYVGSTAAVSTAASLVAIGSAPAWVPLAVGAAAAYGVHTLWDWLTD
ncbi:MAG: lecithin retinol acyltransferase family protein [Aeromonas sp.]